MLFRYTNALTPIRPAKEFLSLTAAMGKKGGGAAQAESKESSKEGYNLLGSPTFEELENGRFKCVETGHELPSHARDSYAQSKHCRLGLIDVALAQNKPPLNMFNQDPQSRSKLICKLTGVTINKSEEHIWKHINGKRFLNMLERKETEQTMSNGKIGKEDDEKPEKKKKKKKKVKDNGLKKKKKKQDKTVSEVISEVRDASDATDLEEDEDDFWMPPVGDRWDNDDGDDRWGSGSESEPENDEADGEDAGTEERKKDAGELSKRTKRLSLEIGPSSHASRKKKKKTKAS